jgi:hypothetical protein
MSNLPELIYPFADTYQLGSDYSADSPNASEIVFGSIGTETNQAVSIYSRVTMRTADNLHFAQFEIAGVFMNYFGVLSEKNRSDTTMNRDNDSNYFRFKLNGTNIEVVCSSGLAQVAHWSGIIAVIPV